MGGAILEISNSASLAITVLIPDTAAKLVAAEIIPAVVACTDIPSSSLSACGCTVTYRRLT